MDENIETEESSDSQTWEKAMSAVPTSTPTYYDAAAAALIQMLHDFEAALPKPPERKGRFREPRDFIRSKAGISPAFVVKTVGMLLWSENLQQVPQLEYDTAQNGMQYVQAMPAVLAKLNELYKTLKLSVDLEKANLAADAQRIYSVARGLAIADERHSLQEEVAMMKRSQRRRRRSKSKK